MARKVTDIPIGPGQLFLAPSGTAFPGDPGITPAAPWADPGYSEKGTELSLDEKRALQHVDEENLPFAAPMGDADEQLRIVLAQPTLANLQYALGGGAITTSAPRTFADGATTNLSPNLTSPALAAFTAADVGKRVSGVGIPTGTYILTYTSATAVIMSANATATGTGVSVTVGAALATYRPPRPTEMEVHYAILLRTKGSIVSGVQMYRDWQVLEGMPMGAVVIPYAKQTKSQLTTIAFQIMLPAAGGDGWTVVEQTA